MPKNIAIYDLDGTLLPFNSFKYWLVYSFFCAPFFLRFDYNCLIFSVSIQRILGRTDRIVFKETLMNFHEQNKNATFVKRCNSSFAAFLKRKTRTVLLGKYAKSFLATAAPDCYVQYYAKKMNCFDDYSASRIENGKLQENMSEKKLQSVIGQIGNEIHNAVLYTDHHDDIALARNVSEVFLVCPTKETKRQYELSKISYIPVCLKTTTYAFVHRNRKI